MTITRHLRKSGDLLEFTSLHPPYFHLLLGSQQEFDEYVCRVNYELPSQHVLRVVRGNKMKRVDDLFNEFAAAFQFPLYFGENWPAFSECMRDLAWLPGQNYIVMLSNSTALLVEDDPRDRDTFIRILHDTCGYWASRGKPPHTAGKVPIPFHIIFHATESQADIARNIVGSQYPVIPTTFIRDLRAAN